MLGLIKKSRDHRDALDRVREWTRGRFKLSDERPIFVAEVACTVPGCPPVETVIAFWTEGDRRHHFKVFKPLAAIVLDDLPPAWLKDALAVPEGFDCDCC